MFANESKYAMALAWAGENDGVRKCAETHENRSLEFPTGSDPNWHVHCTVTEEV